MNTDAKRYYALLGLVPTCSDEDIRSAFRRRAKELHPDAESGNATAFIRLKRAYDTLSDPAKRAHYDRASTRRVRRAMYAAGDPLPPRVRPPRPGGMSVARYFVAFVFVGGLSFGAIGAMISYDEVPPPGSAAPVVLLRPAARDVQTTKEFARPDEAAAAKSDVVKSDVVKSDVWDPSSPNGTPHDAAADDRRPGHPRAGGIAASTSE